MVQPLVAEALSDTWGNPDPYNQVILRPARISPINGVFKRFRYGWTNYGVPNLTSRFHIYQTGQISPLLINLFGATDSWQLLSAACNDSKLMAHVYSQLGVLAPLTRTWYRWSDKKNIFIAVEINERIPMAWAELDVFVHLYKNSFFESALAGDNDALVIDGGLMSSTDDILQMQAQVHAVVNAPGYNGQLIAFVNGRRAPDISLATAKIGDVAEYVHDTSIYKVVDFPITSLPTFQSTLDNKAKRLLHYASSGETLIDYEDHIDFYMLHQNSGVGVYVHKNKADTVRQLTHKDYAIAADYLPPYYDNFKDANGQVDTSKLKLRMMVRYSGQGSAPALDANMSKFLMDLNDLQQQQAMVGVQATFPLWQAANLEKSDYMRLMRSTYNEITSVLVEQAYGYYRVNSILGQSYFKYTSGQLAVPPAFQHGASAFEYDIDGKLLASHSVGDATMYTPLSGSCKLVEFIEGIGSKSIDEFYGSNPVVLEDGYNYRFYLRVMDAQTNLPIWQDVTGTTHYTVESGLAYWGPNTITNSLDRIVRSDKKFLDYEVVLDLDSGLLTHQINYDKITAKGTINSPLAVPLGELDVWLNGQPLVRGVDYILNFPTISVINKEFLLYPGSGPKYQTLRIRMTGFCDAQLQLNPVDETGFVYNGVLSANGQHDLHREKVQRIVVNGALKHLDDVAFLEDGTGQVLNSPVEGKPYEIRDTINRLPGLIESEPYALYRTTRSDTLAAESYASVRLPQSVAYPVSPIASRYKLFSPFLSKILVDLQADYIDLSEFAEPYSDAMVRTLCVPYLYLLPLDPIGPGNLPDTNYCLVHPHALAAAVQLPEIKYQFFQRVLAVFAQDKVVSNTQIQLA